MCAAGGQLPNSVRSVNNGVRGRWWAAAKVGAQLHAGWSNVPDDLLQTRNLDRAAARPLATGQGGPAVKVCQGSLPKSSIGATEPFGP